MFEESHQCAKCGLLQPLTNFQFINYPNRKQRHTICRTCRKKQWVKIARKKWKENNREKYKQRRRATNTHKQIKISTNERLTRKRKRTIAWYKEYKSTLCCKLCQESHPACLDFHHRNPEEKTKDVARLVRDRYSINTIKIEIAKCDVLCQNCHRHLEAEKRGNSHHLKCKCLSIEHSKLTAADKNKCRRLKYLDRRYGWYNEQKINKKCDCGESRIICLDFHHVDRTTKIGDVSVLLGNSKPLDIVKAEIMKCVIICGNCHRKLHYA